MTLWSAVLLGVVLRAAAPSGLWLTLEVQNPNALGGHRILHLEDLVGPARLRIPGLPQPNAILLFTTRAEACAQPEGLCRKLEQRTAHLRQAGALVIGVILTSRERVPIARKKMASLQTPVVLALDPHHHVERAFDLRGPGRLLVLDAEGQSRRVAAASILGGRASVERGLERAVQALSFAMSRVEEED